MTSGTRTEWVKFRATPEEKKAIEEKASAQGQTLADFLRQRALDYRLRQTPQEKERMLLLARIGVNLNQIARWANTHKKSAEAVDVITMLAGLEKAVRADTPPPLQTGSSHVHESISSRHRGRGRPDQLPRQDGLPRQGR